MNILSKSILILVTFIMASSCIKEELIKPDPSFILSFERDGQTNAFAGSQFYIVPTGAGEFFTLFDGTPGRIWGEAGAKGTDFNKADSLIVQYNAAGKYNLTLVTSSSGDFGKEFSRSFKTVEVNVFDTRNSITNFSINGIEGAFTPENEIFFSVPDVTANYNFTPSFGLNSKDAKAFVKGVDQVSGQTINDFSQAVVYVVRSANGEENQYTVKFSTFPSSNEKAITKFVLGKGGHDEIATIDEENKTITLSSNYDSNLAAVRLVLGFSYASTIYFDNVAYATLTSYDLTPKGVKELKVIAQNKTEVIYKLKITSEDPITKFKFAGLIPAPLGVIDPVKKTITIDVYSGTDVTTLIADWTGTLGKVTIGSIDQVNGVTVNDFSKPVSYIFYKGAVRSDRYTVTVNIK